MRILLFLLVACSFVAGCAKKDDGWAAPTGAKSGGVIAEDDDRAARLVLLTLRTLKFSREAGGGLGICKAGGLFTNTSFQFVTSVTAELQIRDTTGATVFRKAIVFDTFRDQFLGFGPVLLPKTAAMEIQDIEVPMEVLARMASYWYTITKVEGYQEDGNSHDPLRMLGAVNANASHVVEVLKANPALVESRDPVSGVTMAHMAFLTGERTLIDYLVASGTDLKVKTKTGIMPIHCAGLAPTDYGLTILRKQGISPDSRDLKGKTPLMIACEFGTVQQVKNLIAAGARADTHSKDGFSPFFFSTFDRRPMGHLEVVEALRKGGFNPNEWSTPHDHPLHIAWDPEVIRFLVSIGGKVNAYARGAAAGHWTPLHQAAKFGKPAQIDALLQCGADPTIKTVPNGNTPADIARNYDRFAEERLIREAMSRGKTDR